MREANSNKALIVAIVENSRVRKVNKLEFSVESFVA